MTKSEKMKGKGEIQDQDKKIYLSLLILNSKNIIIVTINFASLKLVLIFKITSILV